METNRIAIHQNKKLFYHSILWTESWIEFCKKNNLPYKVINCYDGNIIDSLNEFGYLLWNINNYSYIDKEISRSILYSAKRMGIKIFPDYEDIWHYDDKIAETYYLRSINAPIPKTWTFYSFYDIQEWLNKFDLFPIVAKLRCGSGSHNVKLIKNKRQVITYSKKMFGKGFNSQPSIVRKARVNFQSSKNNWDLMKSRIKRIPEFYRTLKSAKKFPREKGYVFFQEFIPNDGYDVKIVVIGNKLGYIGRHVQQNDFRASGAGSLFFDKSLVTKEIIDSAFEVNEKLGFKCMGYDYIINSKTGKAFIIEMSYNFSHKALLQSGGYFDRNGKWYDEPLNAPEEIMKNLLV